MSTETRSKHRESVVELWNLWKRSGRTFDLGKILASSKQLAGEDGVSGRLSELVERELPSRIGTVGVVTWDDESARALLRNLPDYLVEIKRRSDIDMPYDVDQVQYFNDYYRDFTRIVLREAVFPMLFSQENLPHLLGRVFLRDYTRPDNLNWCWFEVMHEFFAIIEEDLGIIYKYG